MNAPDSRLHYMDNLRALAMLAGVAFHAGLAYSILMRPYWPTADVNPSRIVDVVAWFSHLFRMPLFFLVGGFFAAMLVQERGVGGMLGNRLARILLPFVLFWPILHLAMGWLITTAMTHLDTLPPLLMVVKKWMSGPNAPAAPPTLMHLWFLPYLMCFCILVWVVKALEIRWPSRADALLRPAVLSAGWPLLLMAPLFAVPAPMPAPESFFPQWWALMFFGLYFALGYRLFHAPALLDKLAPAAPWLLAAALLAYAVFFELLSLKSPPPSTPWLQLVKAALQAFIGVWMTLCCLVYGKRWLNRGNRVLRYVAESSYWVYIIHLPVLFAVQFLVLPVQAHWTLKFLLSLSATLFIALVSYQVLVRHTVVGRLLNGRRGRERDAGEVGHGAVVQR
ncbi:MAG: acyltransferase family protein [Betaproteobacteria bacterium]|nr:acyltransferase family protein [Betaproteobacteria bacterium]